jgi:hypothetical protein
MTKYEQQLKAMRDRIKSRLGSHLTPDMEELVSYIGTGGDPAKRKEELQIMEAARQSAKQIQEDHKVLDNTNLGRFLEIAHADCNHEFINVGFTTRRMVCKHCDKEE